MRMIKKILCTLLALALCVSLLAGVTASAGTIAYGAATVASASAAIRATASNSGAVIATVKNNERVVVLERTSSSWYHVNCQGADGYMSAAFLRDVLTVETFTAEGTVTGSDVRMRARPNTSSATLGYYSAGTVMTVLGINNGWYHVSYDGTEGYMRSDYINISGGPNAPDIFSTGGGGASSTKGQQIADYALQYDGYPYTAGGATPSVGFDCSGFVYFVYGHFGYTLYRGAEDQANNGTPVTRANLQPGDLVFFTNGGSSIEHVGIYIGGDQFIHARNSSYGVVVDSLASGGYWMSVYWGARRIV